MSIDDIFKSDRAKAAILARLKGQQAPPSATESTPTPLNTEETASSETAEDASQDEGQTATATPSDDAFKKAILAGLKRQREEYEKSQAARKTQSPDPSSPPTEGSKASANLTAKDETPPHPPEDSDVWQFFARPVVDLIEKATHANPLLPVFVIENPYPAFDEEFAAALGKMLNDFRVVSIAEVGRERLGGILQNLANKKKLRLAVLCTSRHQLPADIVSAIRMDGYCQIPRLTEARLREYATVNQLPMADGSISWAQWIGPQELILANSLPPQHWWQGLCQLAAQRHGGKAEQQIRTLDQMYGVTQAKNWALQLKNDIQLALTPGSGVTWNEVDRGALLVGPPGTGKTTLAQAIAHECQTNFISIKPTKDWMTGNGLDECINLMVATFATARQQDPCIVFIDEIDTIGNRENFSGHNASWNTSFLNALLTEMDGFPGDQVIVIAATNYAENVDAALKRAGRLDRIIHLPRPDLQALQAMLKGKLGPYSYNISEADFTELARNCFGLTGADIEVLVRGARRRARLDGNRPISKADLFEEIYNIPRTAERQPLSHAELERTAYHEAGHALIALQSDTLREHLRIASIIPDDRGSLGFVALNASPRNETRQSLLDRLCMALAGRAAEELTFGPDQLSTGAGGSSPSCDLVVARRLAEAWLGLYGFSELSPNWHTDEPDPKEAQALIQTQYQRALSALTSQQARLNAIAQQLLNRHVLTRTDLEYIEVGG